MSALHSGTPWTEWRLMSMRLVDWISPPYMSPISSPEDIWTQSVKRGKGVTQLVLSTWSLYSGWMSRERVTERRGVPESRDNNVHNDPSKRWSQRLITLSYDADGDDYIQLNNKLSPQDLNKKSMCGTDIIMSSNGYSGYASCYSWKRTRQCKRSCTNIGRWKRRGHSRRGMKMRRKVT